MCARNGITLGKDATHFDPFNYITRYQVISMVVRAANNLTPGLLMPPPPDYGIWRGRQRTMERTQPRRSTTDY